jgi:hypothetical protein
MWILQGLPYILNIPEDGSITLGWYKSSKEYLNQIAWDKPSITMASGVQGCTDKRTYIAPNKKHFTVKELVEVVEEWERIDRPRSNWFGGVDEHHIFFEGLKVDENNVAVSLWGS